MKTTEETVRFVRKGTRPGYPIEDHTFELSQGEESRFVSVGITDKATMSARQLTAEERIRASEQWVLKLQRGGELPPASGEEPLLINMPDGAFYYFANNRNSE